MSKRTNEMNERLEQFAKSDLALRKTIAKRQARLDASRNERRVVEQAIGGQLIENKRRSR